MAGISPQALKSLHQFTEILVSHGLDYAKENEKDFARDISRYVRNSCILEILKTSGVGLPVAQLETDLNWLHLACHPQDVPDFKPDLKAIRESLARIERQLSQQNEASGGDIGSRHGEGIGGRASREAAACPPSLSTCHNSIEK